MLDKSFTKSSKLIGCGSKIYIKQSQRNLAAFKANAFIYKNIIEEVVSVDNGSQKSTGTKGYLNTKDIIPSLSKFLFLRAFKAYQPPFYQHPLHN